MKNFANCAKYFQDSIMKNSFGLFSLAVTAFAAICGNRMRFAFVNEGG